MLHQYPNMLSRQRGFTLIELSIVLVIIGLISAGVLVGRDMIRAAEVRQQIAQIDHFDTAAHTFRTKYNCIPGDCPEAENTGLGTAGGPGENGNGDGKLTGGDGDYTHPDSLYTLNQPELINFWYHLARANLASDNFPGYTGIGLYAPGIDTPLLKMKGRGAFGHVAGNGMNPAGGLLVIPIDNSNNSGAHDTMGGPVDALVPGRHGFLLTASSSYTANGGVFTGDSLYAIDSKMDDGVPDTGRAVGIVWGLGQMHNPAYPLLLNTQNACIDRTTDPFHYRVKQVAPDAPIYSEANSLCSLLVGASF